MVVLPTGRESCEKNEYSNMCSNKEKVALPSDSRQPLERNPRSAAGIITERGEGPLPGELGGCRIEHLRPGVIEECVLGARVLVCHE